MCVIAISFQVPLDHYLVFNTNALLLHYYHLVFPEVHIWRPGSHIQFYWVRLMIRGIGAKKNLNLVSNFKWVNSVAR